MRFNLFKNSGFGHGSDNYDFRGERQQLFHFFSGISLEPQVTYSYEEDLPTPVGVAIPSIGEFAMTGHDTAGEVATIEWRQFPDSDRASEATRQMVEMMLAPSGTPMPEVFDLSQVVIEDHGTFEMDLVTGVRRRPRDRR